MTYGHVIDMSVVSNPRPLDSLVFPDERLDLEVVEINADLIETVIDDTTVLVSDVVDREEVDMEILDYVRGDGNILPYYTGDYTVVPKREDQILRTKDKSMSANVTVKEISHQEVDNPAGGQTFIIGFA